MLGCVVGVGLEYLVDYDHETCHDHELDNDADVGGDSIAYERDDHVGKGEHGDYRDAHDDGGLEFGRDCQH